jgi:hypothetical protein
MLSGQMKERVGAIGTSPKPFPEPNSDQQIEASAL